MSLLAAVVIALLVLVLLVLLALMRDVALLHEKISIYRQLLLRPARPSYIGEAMPRALREVLGAPSPLSADDLSAARALVMFMRPDCAACHELAARLAGDPLTGDEGLDLIAVIGRGPRTQRMVERMNAAGFEVRADPSEALFDAAEIRSTPTMILWDRSSNVAADYAEGSDFAWLRETIRRTRTLPVTVRHSSRGV